MEGIRAREILLLPQTLKNRRQLAHKLLRYTINEKFRNIPNCVVVNTSFSRLSVDRANAKVSEKKISLSLSLR